MAGMKDVDLVRAEKCLLVFSTTCLMSLSGALAISRVSAWRALSFPSLFRRRCSSIVSAGNSLSYLLKSSFGRHHDHRGICLFMLIFVGRPLHA